MYPAQGIRVNPVALVELSTDPTDVANTGFLYTNDVAGVTELFYDDPDGAEVQITSGAGLNGGAITGPIRIADGSAAAPAYSFSSDPDTGFYSILGNYMGVAVAGQFLMEFNAGGPSVSSTASYSFNSAGAGSTPDVYLYRDAANTLALKNSTTAQEFRVYGTTTGPKYGYFKHNGTNTYLDAVGGGVLLLGGTVSVQMNDVNLTWFTDNALDIGASGATRPRTGYFGTALVVGTTPAATGTIRIPNNVGLAWRNAANSGDIDGVFVNSSDQLVLGTGVTVTMPNGILSIGTNPASAGAMRFANNAQIKWRNAANSGDVNGWWVDTSDALATDASIKCAGAFIQIGTNPAASGQIRMANTNSIVGRNAANSADINMLNITSGNIVAVGVDASTAIQIGGVSSCTVGFFGATPAARPAGIANADGTLADITTKFNTLINSVMETLGLIATV